MASKGSKKLDMNQLAKSIMDQATSGGKIPLPTEPVKKDVKKPDTKK